MGYALLQKRELQSVLGDVKTGSSLEENNTATVFPISLPEVRVYDSPSIFRSDP
jgi:hypothetical protein